MKQFAKLIKVLDSTNKTSEKVSALASYFQEAEDKDRVWTIAILSHRRPPRPVNTTLLRICASEAANIPLWLFEDSYHIVGDLAETIALIIPSSSQTSNRSLHEYLEDLITLRLQSDEEKKTYLNTHWQQLGYYERFVFNKLITGGFRIGVSQKLMTKALSLAVGIDADVLAYKLMGKWDPSKVTFQELVLDESTEEQFSKPYPFYLAYALEGTPESLGDINDWFVEHKWDGIRAQIIFRNDQVFIWSRGEELVTDKYPELLNLQGNIPNGSVLDGEILPYINGNIGTFHDLQTRIGRKTISKKLLESTPIVYRAYDLLEWKGSDLRELAFNDRRKLLEDLYEKIQQNTFQLSKTYAFKYWEEVGKERSRSRELRSEGLMLKRKDASYKVGRKKGDWWKWKVDPMTIDAVLTYAMRGHGRRSNLFTDYTFALWQENEEGKRMLVTFAKAYSGLTDIELQEIDKFIKKNTLERFGPVRSVTPQLVFEIAFEGISLSNRHKSGVATRFPRILRWRKDKTIHEANSIEDIKSMIL